MDSLPRLFGGKRRGIMKNKRLTGHLAALFTAIVWGTTFISTKILLVDFQPVEILFFRFVLGYVILFAACPRRLKRESGRQEGLFVLAGLCGICLYYLMENIALTYTMASNVGVVVSVAPFFTAVLAHLLIPEGEKLGMHFFAGFTVAMAGIVLISFNGTKLQVNPIGDILSVGAAVVWAFYSLLSRRIGGLGYPVIPATRRIFFYGIICMVPALFFFDFQIGLDRFANMTSLLNLLYLGMGASALCFVTWNYAVKVLGAVQTSVYIYLVPVITIITSFLFLKEPVTWMSAAGTALTIAGLVVSEWRVKGARK